MKQDQHFHLREHTALWIAISAALIIAVLLWVQTCIAPNLPPATTGGIEGGQAIPFALPTPADADISDFTALYAQDLQTSDDVIVGDDLEVQGGAAAIYGTTPALTLGDAGAEDTKIVFDGNAQDFYLALDDSADDLLLGLGSAVGTTGILHLDASQDVGLGGASAGAKLDVTGNVLVDGSADEAQLTVQGYTTQTNSLAAFEDSGGTDIVTIAPAAAAGSGSSLFTVADTFNIMNGSDASIGLDVNLTGANHTGASNTLVGIDLDLTTADADATESAVDISDTDWDYGIYSAANQQNYFLPSVESATVTTDTTDMFTFASGEVVVITDMVCQTTTSFDCTGDDCTLVIGDGNDANGFLDFADDELQTTDAEFTGATAAWHGQHADSLGVYLATNDAFVYTNDGIDADFGGTGVQNGSITCYLFYTRIQ